MNICGIHMTFAGDEKEINCLHGLFSTATATKKARFTEIMSSVGIVGDDPLDGEILRVDGIENAGSLVFFHAVGCSAFVFFADALKAIVDKVAPNVKVFYSASEPMTGFYETNDTDGQFYASAENA